MTAKTSPLRVLMVAARYLPYVGGLETHVHEVGRRLVRAGVKVTILTTDVSRQLPIIDESEGMLIHRVPAWPPNKDYYFAPDIYRMITKEQWDIIHCQGYHNLVAPLAMLAAQRARIPYMVTFHSGGDSSRLRKALRGVQRLALRPLLAQAAQLICPSKWELEFFRKQLRLSHKQFVVIPNGAHHLTNLIDPVRRTTNDVLVLSVGRLERYKGHQRVITALPKLLEHVPEARLRIVGVGPYESSLHAIARKHGVSERVEIRPVPPGDQNGMASLIAQADLVTLLSEHEAQGIAVLEALALRRPVLVAGTSALQEFADQGFARAVPLKSTPDEVARAMLRQLHQPLQPANIVLPTWDDCAAALLSLYEVHTRRIPGVAS